MVEYRWSKEEKEQLHTLRKKVFMGGTSLQLTWSAIAYSINSQFHEGRPIRSERACKVQYYRTKKKHVTVVEGDE